MIKVQFCHYAALAFARASSKAVVASESYKKFISTAASAVWWSGDARIMKLNAKFVPGGGAIRGTHVSIPLTRGESSDSLVEDSNLEPVS
jgi:hypothetical protein